MDVLYCVGLEAFSTIEELEGSKELESWLVAARFLLLLVCFPRPSLEDVCHGQLSKD